MSNFLLQTGIQFMALENSASDKLTGRIFGLDLQLFVDAAILAISIFVLFTGLSYLLFNPARELLRKRQEKIKAEMEAASKEKSEAINFKSEYDAKLRNVDKEADQILSEARKKALKREDEIVNEAKIEANRIIDRANKEVELEKNKVKDEVKKEIISVASLMTEKIIASSIDETKQEELIEETLKEMGDKTWQS